MAAGHDVRGSYDALASAYATALLDELAGKPLDRALLDCFAEQTRGGAVLDAGCGPGQIARYLHDRGADVEGVDLSPGMIAEAKRHHPGLRFTVGDLTALPYPDGRFAGVAAFYAIVNFAPATLGAPLRELHRVLAPGGRLLLSFHLGHAQHHADEMWGVPVALDFWFLERAHVEAVLRDVGFTIEMRLEREPYLLPAPAAPAAPAAPGASAEHPSQRAYLLARRI